MPGSGETIVMTAVGMLCRQYNGVNRAIRVCWPAYNG